MRTQTALRWIGCALVAITTLAAGCADDDDDGTMADTTDTGASGGTSADTGMLGDDVATGGASNTSVTDTTASNTSMTDTTNTSGGMADDLEMEADDFTCITEWDKVRRFRITNLLGRLDETLAVANNPEGGAYPVGTIIQLIPDEAMVKRRAGWSPETNDWEFFFLENSADGTVIADRGTTDVVNAFGGNCLDCHAKAEPQWDFVCEQDHGCDPLPFGEDLINTLQEGDPRCP